MGRTETGYNKLLTWGHAIHIVARTVVIVVFNLVVPAADRFNNKKYKFQSIYCFSLQWKLVLLWNLPSLTASTLFLLKLVAKFSPNLNVLEGSNRCVSARCSAHFWASSWSYIFEKYTVITTVKYRKSFV